ncbi:type I DNA topoisomerase [Parachlamydia sp. AcF125]|uniref:type I DNA topoisomerase n=1 Tax=Parachlamydia sp. AcF125 TaxID=2795736 RepID=UPI001BC8F1EF|nr:type I DNA topoisomerase [Parachlamydia sp. AcF125]MBS4169011.1 DNA topoisomerase 1 [Parachlamydia sp. AcF125]
MGKALIIVESPAKIKTLKKFLGPNYIFESSIGHIRDLPEKEFGIDVDHDFEPKYVIMPDKEKVIANLRKAAKNVDTVYLSPDPDREGEAIAWHITQILPNSTRIKRVSFNSITKEAVIKALESPREIDFALVNAQQARRLLDRIVGYKISPILNRRIQRGKEGFVSAGRVQSVALKMVVDREKAIEIFKPVEYWNLGAILKTEKEPKNFRANLHSIGGKRIEKELVEGKEVVVVDNKEKADAILARMKTQSFYVVKVERKEKKRNPVPPFITSTLQQEASRHYGFSSAKTMNIAQNLYEGVDLGNEGSEGLITYMRTDSVRIAPEALKEARQFILNKYGKEFLPAETRSYSTSKSAQDAHEAIRPTSLNHSPENIKNYLTREQFLLYELIWKRFIASQMAPAIYDTVSADIAAGDEILLRATGSVMKFQGFLVLYEEKEDDEVKNEEGRMLPHLEEGQSLQLIELISEQAFTRPPPRFTEASLVKELEKCRIGRPSTYATIMNKIQSRDYTIKENGRLKPTELGVVIVQMLENNFQQIMNVGFTASMEDGLELIAENQQDWKGLIRDFWGKFMPTLEEAEKSAFVPKVMTEIDCPNCGAKLQKVWSKSKYFYGCSRYPECNYSAPIEEIAFNKDEYAADFDWDQKCPECQSAMKVRHGRFGAFLGCTRYPDCRGIVNIPKKGEAVIPAAEMPACVAVGCPGHMVARKSRFGKTFYSCSTFPECDVIVNELSQLPEKYPNHPRKAYVKKAGKGKKEAAKKRTASSAKKSSVKKEKKGATRLQPLQTLSPELAQVVGASEMARGEVMKKVWDYIRAHQLQDPTNKRLINPDAALAKVFGGPEPIDMFKMTAALAKHVHKKE